MVKSKYSLHALAGIFAFLGMAGMILYFSTTVNLWEKSEKTGLPNFILLIFLLLLTLSFLFWLLKIIPNISIGDKHIQIGGLVSKIKTITNDDIKKVNLFAPGSIMSWTTIVTRIELTNGKFIKIANPEYRNIGKMRLALIENFPDKIKSFHSERKNTDTYPISKGEFLKFSGSPIFNFNTIMFGGLMLFMLSIVFSQNRPKDIWLALSLCLPLFYFILGHQSYYFLIDRDLMTIRNHFFFWINKKILLKDIIAANFEHPGKLSKSLRITTKDFKSKYYSAGSLREKDWKALKEKIDELGIYFIP